MFEQLRYDFVLECVTPLAHASESIGNTSLCMREKRRMRNGSLAFVPVITGDTMRHGMRAASAYAVLDASGLLDKPGLSEEALRLLFAGGMITGSEGGAVKLDDYRRMVELIPPLGIFGGCAQNRSIPGKVQVCAPELVCEETAHRMPEWVTGYLREQGSSLLPSRSHIEEVQRVRMDPTLDTSMRRLLSDGGASVENRLLSSEHGKDVGDAVLAQDSKSSMMPRRYETIITGSLFFWSVFATVHSELERDTFNASIGAFLLNAQVGGKKATGHGRIAPAIAKQITVQRPREAPENLDAGALAPKIGSLFYEHVKARKDDVAKWLREVDA